MLTIHRRDLYEDKAYAQELKHAPKTSDKPDSYFAVSDRTLVLGSSTHALFVVALADLFRAYKPPVAK